MVHQRPTRVRPFTHLSSSCFLCYSYSHVIAIVVTSPTICGCGKNHIFFLNIHSNDVWSAVECVLIENNWRHECVLWFVCDSSSLSGEHVISWSRVCGNIIIMVFTPSLQRMGEIATQIIWNFNFRRLSFVGDNSMTDFFPISILKLRYRWNSSRADVFANTQSWNIDFVSIDWFELIESKRMTKPSRSNPLSLYK